MKHISFLFAVGLIGLLASCHPVNDEATSIKPTINVSAAPEPTNTSPMTVDLLDGELAANWRGFKSEQVPLGWTLANGVLTFMPPTKVERAEAQAAGRKAGGDLVSLKTFGDFELNMDWKITEGGNSGIFVRANEQFGKPWHSSIEIQIIDHTEIDMTNSKQALHNAGAIYDLYPAHPDSFVPIGEWNKVKIRMVGSKVTVTQNGQLVADVDMNSEEFKNRFKNSKFQRVAPLSGSFASGFIGLQDHGGECAYRNIRVTEL